MILNFGEYLPDRPPQSNPGLTVAKNCIPNIDYYSEFNDAVVFSSNALSDRCRGAMSMKDTTGSWYTYAGDEDKLYRLSGNTWYDASKSITGGYSTATSDNWEFAQWGNFCLATNGAYDLQEVTLGATTFASVAGSPPVSKHIDVVRDFVVIGNIASYPCRVQWCGFNNKDTWTAAPSSTQADFQDLNHTYGSVQRVVGGEIGIVFQEYAITRMLYVSTPLIWQFDTIETNKGTPSPKSVVKVGGNIYYLGHDSFYMFNGAASTDIASERVYKTFLNDLDTLYYNRISATSDPNKNLVYWAYPSTSATAGTPNRVIVYNYAVNKWAGPIEINVELLFRWISTTYTLEEIDAIYPNLDTMSLGLDSPVWQGGVPFLGGFNSSHKLCAYAGSPLTAVFETGEKQLTQGRRSFISMSRPLVEGGSASSSVAIAGRNTSKETETFSTDIPTNSEGECQLNNESRYHRFRVTVAGGFSHAYGIEIEGGLGGRY